MYYVEIIKEMFFKPCLLLMLCFMIGYMTLVLKYCSTSLVLTCKESNALVSPYSLAAIGPKLSYFVLFEVCWVWIYTLDDVFFVICQMVPEQQSKKLGQWLWESILPIFPLHISLPFLLFSCLFKSTCTYW